MNNPTCLCGREDWIYDAEVGQWCCGCGYVKNATGKGFKEGRLALSEERRIVDLREPYPPKLLKTPLP